MIIPAQELIEFTKSENGKYDFEKIDENKAFDFCKKIALGHYENFPVGSILIPKKIRKYIYSIYAFARIADDIADELTKILPKENVYEILDNYEQNLFKNAKNSLHEIKNPIFYALKITIDKFSLPLLPFQKLLSAFKSDILFKGFNNFDELLEYCNNSANPIGELLLRLFEEYNEENILHSNQICSALQLINFWQDLSIDIQRNRCYIPRDKLLKYNIDTNDIQSIHDLQKLLNELYNFTNNLLNEGKQLVPKVHNLRFRLELRAIIWGGERILKKNIKLKTNILTQRPCI